MKLEISTQQFKDCIKRCRAAMVDNPSPATLLTILFRATASRLTLIAGDGQMFTRCDLFPVDGQYRFTKESRNDADDYEICIPGDRLEKTIDLISSDDSVYVYCLNDSIHITGDTGSNAEKKVILKGISTANYPLIPIVNIEAVPEGITVSPFDGMKDLMTGMKACLKTVLSNTEEGSHLKFCGVAIKPDANKIKLASADRSALMSVCEINVKPGKDENSPNTLSFAEVIIPGRTVSKLKTITDGNPSSVMVLTPESSAENKWIEFVCQWTEKGDNDLDEEYKRVSILTRCIAGELFDGIRKLLSTDFMAECVTTKSEFEAALKGCEIFSEKIQLLFDPEDGTLRASSRSDYGENKDFLTCPIQAQNGEKYQGECKIEYLKEVLKGIHTDTIKLAIRISNLGFPSIYLLSHNAESNVSVEYMVAGINPNAAKATVQEATKTKVRSAKQKVA